jgi:excisionase family DNA binding protein
MQAKDSQHESPYMLKSEAIAYLRITEPTLDKLIREGQLTAYRLGPRLIRLRREDVEALLQPIEAA